MGRSHRNGWLAGWRDQGLSSRPWRLGRGRVGAREEDTTYSDSGTGVRKEASGRHCPGTLDGERVAPAVIDQEPCRGIATRFPWQPGPSKQRCCGGSRLGGTVSERQISLSQPALPRGAGHRLGTAKHCLLCCTLVGAEGGERNHLGTACCFG